MTYDIIVADVAGQFEALERLIKKLPKGNILFVGDLIDRGPKSREVVELVMKNHASLMGNHEHMLLDYVKGCPLYKDQRIWLNNGGDATLDGYGFDGVNPDTFKIPSAHVEWLSELPTYYEDDRVFVSHAPWKSGLPLSSAKTLAKFGGINTDSLIWNRHGIQKRDKLQIFGHNSHWGLKRFEKDGDPYGICLDDSWNKVLTAYHIPSGEVFQEPYFISA